MSVAAYQKANQNTENPRQTEYRAFAIFTRALEEAEAKGPVEVVKAVADNRQLWLTLQMDLASEDNKLPKELKAQLISISIWVNRYSAEALKGEASLEPLITVNKQIMEGLRGTSSSAEAEAPSPTA
ncbi:flagellar biosynthesis regulator FlaF [Sneathiella sp. P13V-1]|uniref:flagellar biosynthesis regulator FlaF n=1 Tax=Sneathiella sp. P13V-1 TaxID=2697366 RepID=UPI00187B3B5A|nr:flagellar biosynthesis regulator FlaF [Sneathiella sp. P13V-1]MBE7635217.1 flagellar biosynthesis regulator FlaF [Sneathiella sp. P13V-1]